MQAHAILPHQDCLGLLGRGLLRRLLGHPGVSRILQLLWKQLACLAFRACVLQGGPLRQLRREWRQQARLAEEARGPASGACGGAAMGRVEKLCVTTVIDDPK